MSPIIDVEPDVFDAASAVFGKTVVDQLTDAVLGVKRGLQGTGGMAGTDPGGMEWSKAYDDGAQVTVGGMSDLTYASYKLAAMLEMTGFNHGQAEQASDRTVFTTTDTTKYQAPATLSCDPEPPSAAGGSGHPPKGWGLIQHAVGYVWPNGDPGKLRTAAKVWAAAADRLNIASYEIPEALHAIRSQQSPEVEDVATVCQAMMDHIQDVASGCRDLSTACSELANHIDQAHKEVIDELEELLAWTIAIEGAGAVASIFTGGLAQIPTQAAEAARIAATALRVGTIISKLASAARTVAAGIGKVVTKIGEAVKQLAKIRNAKPAKSATEEAKTLTQIAKAEKAIGTRTQKVAETIGDPKKFDPDSIKGMNSKDLENTIPSSWTREPSNSGGGTVFKDPNNSGRQIRIMPGYTKGNRSDPTTHGPYAVISQNSKAVKIPLEGNPTLGGK